jgi:hypothetical protein
MPTFRVTDPNTGRTIRLTGDSPPTQQELEQIFSQFQVEQEPVIDPEALVRSPTAQRRTALEELARDVGPIEAATIGAGRGLTTLGRAVGLAEPETAIERQAFAELERQRPVATTVGEVAGEAAPFLAAAPLAGAGLAATTGGRVLIPAATTIGQRALGSAALGATEAGLIATGRGATGEEAIIAGGLGGAIAGGAEMVLPVIGRLGGRLIRQVTGRQPTSPILDASGRPSAELQDALSQAGLTIDDLGEQARRQLEVGDIADPAALARQQFLERQGLTPTRAQITGEATDFQTQQELAKTSGRVREALQAQEQVLGDQFENAITATGGSANRSNSTAFDFIADRSIEQDAAISDAYNAARQLASDQKVIRGDRLAKTLKDAAPFNEQTGGLVSSVRGILRQRGVIDKKFRPIGRIDANTAEQIRIDINGLFDSTTPLGRSKIRDLKNALDDDVAAAVGEDVFSGARAAKAKFESDLARSKVNKFDKRKKNVVRDILENKVNPDRFLDEAVLSKTIRGDDVRQLKTFLNLDGPGPGADAWNDLRAEAMQRIKSDAFSEVGGELALSRAKLEGALNRFGEAKLKALFDPSEMKFINDMLKVSKLREPVRGTALGRGPTAQAVGRLEDTIKRIPLLANVFEGIATDAAGRIVVKPPVMRAPLQPSPAGQAIPLVTPAIPAAIAAQEQQ